MKGKAYFALIAMIGCIVYHSVTDIAAYCFLVLHHYLSLHIYCLLDILLF